MQKCLSCGLDFEAIRGQTYCTEKCRKKEEKRRWRHRRAAPYWEWVKTQEPIWAAARAAKAARKKPWNDLLERWVGKAVWWPSGCLLWVGSVDGDGYPRLRYNGEFVRVTRLICGIDDDRRALHTCDVPECINPAHLYVGTPKDNSDDMRRRGRAHTHKDGVNGRFAKRD